MPQLLHQVYANVRDFDAKGNGRDDDTAFIQAAIDNKEGHHVLFPRGELEPSGEINPYKILGHLKFQNDGQRCIFLAGASLELDSDYASVIISGKSQTLTGLWITVGTASYGPHSGSTAVPDPCLLIDGADDLLLEDLHVGCSSAGTLVRIRNAEGVTIRGGRLTGVNELKENTGLDIGSGARNVSALHLTMDQLGYGVVLQDNTENISFVNCNIEHDFVHMIEVRGQVHGLTLIGVHMEGGTSDIYDGEELVVHAGACQFIVVLAGGGVYGGCFVGCLFGGLRPFVHLAEVDPVDTPDYEASTGAFWGTPRRIFVIEGEWCGVNVWGCNHKEGSADYELYAVWEIASTATVSRSCDMFNYWDKIGVAGGPPTITSDFSALALTAPMGIRLNAAKLGFFGATPVARTPKYTVGVATSRELTSANAYEVLGTLLQDLAAIGLIECQVR